MKTYYKIFAYHKGNIRGGWYYDDCIYKPEKYIPQIKAMQAKYPSLKFKIIKFTEEIYKRF